MDTNTRRVGRPKASPRTGPLVLEGTRSRTKIELELATETADELKEYARWVSSSSTLATGDAIFTTVDFALRDVFRRDRLWQEQRRKGDRKDTAPPRPAQAQPASTTPSLPPAISKQPVPTRLPAPVPGVRT